MNVYADIYKVCGLGTTLFYFIGYWDKILKSIYPMDIKAKDQKIQIYNNLKLVDYYKKYLTVTLFL